MEVGEVHGLVNSSTVTPNAAARDTRARKLGSRSPDSYRQTEIMCTLDRSPSLPWVQPRALRVRSRLLDVEVVGHGIPLSFGMGTDASLGLCAARGAGKASAGPATWSRL